jgi:hypothetical protein
MAEEASLSFLARFLHSRGTNLKSSQQGFPATDLVRTISQCGIGANESRFFATLRFAPAAAGHVILSLPPRGMSS